MRRAIAILVALGMSCIVQASTPDRAIDAFIAREMPASGAPGLAYAVVDDGDIRADARGETLKGSGEPVIPDTPFLLGSVSKSFTAMAVMQLVEAGTVDLDTGIGRYLPIFAQAPARDVTLRQLLSHTSGFSTLQGNQAHVDSPRSGDALTRQVARIATWTPPHAPGTHWAYSNANYLILGALIERISGQDYASYITAHILKPLGMTHSFVSDGAHHPGMARGHMPWFGGKRAMADAPTGRIMAPAGGVIASARDVARYLGVMMNGRDDVIRAPSKAMMMRPASDVSPYYGFGWNLDPESGAVYHSGNSPGVETLVSMKPDAGKGAVVLVNAAGGMGFGDTVGLRVGIATLALGEKYDGPGGNWGPKSLYLAIAIVAPLFLIGMVVAWRGRNALRAKSGAFGRFSLWFPLAATLAMAWVFVILIPHLFGTPIANLYRYQPDMTLMLIAGAVTGVAWAVLRLGIAYSGKR